MSEPAVVVEELRKRYGGKDVLDGVSFSVTRGEVVALLGPNGAGKTTTLEILEGLRTADSGRVSVLGLDPARQLDRLSPRMGVMLQEGGVPLGLRTGEVMRLFAALHADPMPRDEVLDLVGLTEQARTTVRHLSGGQKQRLSLGLALVGRPELVFLDEPTVGMDASARRATWRSIRDIVARGTTVILTTHHLDEAEALADRVAILGEGRIVALDTPENLSAASAHRSIEVTTVEPIDAVALASALSLEVHALGGTRVRIDVEPTPEVVANVTRALAERDILIREMRVATASLEETFLQLTGDGGASS